MSTPGIQTTSHSPPTYFLDRTSSTSTFPDGLNHALNQENMRLQQIVYEHRVRIVFAIKMSVMINILQLFVVKGRGASKRTSFYEISTIEEQFMPMQQPKSQDGC